MFDSYTPTSLLQAALNILQYRLLNDVHQKSLRMTENTFESFDDLKRIYVLVMIKMDVLWFFGIRMTILAKVIGGLPLSP